MNNYPSVSMFEPEGPEEGFSNTKDYSISGYSKDQNVTPDPSHEQAKQWSDKQIAETGLIDKEPL